MTASIYDKITSLTESGNIARAYAKTGMNALARLRGYEYAPFRPLTGSGGGS